MKKILIPLFLIILVHGCKEVSQKQSTSQTNLWPLIEPYDSGYFKVSELHELYYEQVGNPEGEPVFMLHGGPGGGCSPAMRRFFNPDVFHVILFDQRGANRSRPYAEIKENNTQVLIQDIEKLRKHFGFEKIMLVGGSWGSTLALAYAEAYPDHVSKMIIRGIWTATKKEIDHFYHGGTFSTFPDVYTEFLESLPDSTIRPLPDYLLSLLTGNDDKLRKRIAGAWLKYEWRISVLNADPDEIDQWLSQNDPQAFSLIENYYMANGCFIDENQLWDYLYKITDIPTIIINGRFDMPCPPETAYRLHQALPNSELKIVEMAGHGGPGILEAMAKAVSQFEPQ